MKTIKILTLFFIGVLILIKPANVSAYIVDDVKKEYVITNLSYDERMKNLEKARREYERSIESYTLNLSDEFSNNNASPLSQYSYEYKTTYGSPTIKQVSGELGGQRPGGTRLASGGVFLVAFGGGPSYDFSISYAYEAITFSLSLGMVTGTSVTGVGVKPDNTYDYFKVHGKYDYDVQPYITYTRLRHSNDPWKVYTKGALKTLYRDAYWCVAQ